MRKLRLFLVIIIVVFLTFLFRISVAREKWKSITTDNGLPNRFIKVIKSDGKRVWIGTANGLAIYDLNKKKITKITTKNGLVGNYITSIGIDKNYVWIGSDKGLSRYDIRKKKFLNFTKKDGLPDNYITAIAVTKNFIWVGTKMWGIARYDKITKNWKLYSVLQGLADNSINDIAVDGSIIWVGTKNGLSYYDNILGMWFSYDTSNGFPDANIKSIAVDGEYIWCGTMNGLARFNKYEETVKVYTSDNGLADDVIQKVKLDGKFLWIGTFSGVSRYDKEYDKWLTLTTKDGLIENSISAIEVDGNYIWFGTDGSGISVYDKELPQAYISPLSYYESAGKIVIIGTAFDYDKIKKYRIYYKNDAMKNWMSEDVKLLTSRNVYNSKLAIWNVSKLLNLNYDVKLEVTDRKGKKNYVIYPFIIDTKKPKLVLNPLPYAVKEKTIYISGKYIENNLTTVLVKPYMVKADINRALKQFTTEVNLKRGINNIKIVAYDIANQTFSSKVTVIYDTEKPVIVLNKIPETTNKREITISGFVRDSALKNLFLNANNNPISFVKDKEENNKFNFEKSIKLKSGINKFKIIAYDYVGNKSVYNFSIELKNNFPAITLNKDILKVSSPDYIVKGEWSDDNIDYILIEPFNKRAKVDIKKHTFSLKVKLKEGENVITANIIDKDGNKNFDVMTVVYSTTKSYLTFTEYPEYTSDNNIIIKGKYSEPNLSKIIIKPLNKNAVINMNKKSFLFTITLSKETNDFEIDLIDKFNSKTSKNIRIIWDRVKPIIHLDKISKIAFYKYLTIKGTYEEKYIDTIIAQPGDIKAKINGNKFRIKYPLEEGDNNITVTAFDKAGNFSSTNFTVVYQPQALASAGIDTEYVKKLKKEISYLKSLLKKGNYTYVKKFYMPDITGGVILPQSYVKNNSILKITEKYLGSLKYINFVNKYNLIYSFQKKDILFPTKKFILKYYSLPPILQKVIDIAMISFNYSYHKKEVFYKEFLYFLYRENIIKELTLRKNLRIGRFDIIIGKRINKLNSISIIAEKKRILFYINVKNRIAYAQ